MAVTPPAKRKKSRGSKNKKKPKSHKHTTAVAAQAGQERRGGWSAQLLTEEKEWKLQR